MLLPRYTFMLQWIRSWTNVKSGRKNYCYFFAKNRQGLTLSPETYLHSVFVCWLTCLVYNYVLTFFSDLLFSESSSSFASTQMTTWYSLVNLVMCPAAGKPSTGQNLCRTLFNLCNRRATPVLLLVGYHGAFNLKLNKFRNYPHTND